MFPRLGQKEIDAQSNEWILLTRLGEGQFTEFQPPRDRIRTACTHWAKQVDLLNENRWGRQNRFIDRWLGEIDDRTDSGVSFPVQF